MLMVWRVFALHLVCFVDACACIVDGRVVNIVEGGMDGDSCTVGVDIIGMYVDVGNDIVGVGICVDVCVDGVDVSAVCSQQQPRQ